MRHHMYITLQARGASARSTGAGIEAQPVTATAVVAQPVAAVSVAAPIDA